MNDLLDGILLATVAFSNHLMLRALGVGYFSELQSAKFDPFANPAIPHLHKKASIHDHSNGEDLAKNENVSRRPYRARDRGSHAFPELFTKLSNRICVFFSEREGTQQAHSRPKHSRKTAAWRSTGPEFAARCGPCGVGSPVTLGFGVLWTMLSLATA